MFPHILVSRKDRLFHKGCHHKNSAVQPESPLWKQVVIASPSLMAAYHYVLVKKHLKDKPKQNNWNSLPLGSHFRYATLTHYAVYNTRKLYWYRSAAVLLWQSSYYHTRLKHWAIFGKTIFPPATPASWKAGGSGSGIKGFFLCTFQQCRASRFSVCWETLALKM